MPASHSMRLVQCHREQHGHQGEAAALAFASCAEQLIHLVILQPHRISHPGAHFCPLQWQIGCQNLVESYTQLLINRCKHVRSWRLDVRLIALGSCSARCNAPCMQCRDSTHPVCSAEIQRTLYAVQRFNAPCMQYRAATACEACICTH